MTHEKCTESATPGVLPHDRWEAVSARLPEGCAFRLRKRSGLVAVLRGFLEGLPEVRFAYLYGSFLEDLPVRDLDAGIFFDPALGREEVLRPPLDLASTSAVLRAWASTSRP